ncbi:interleukin-17D isoform X1 [Vicugna pacos]|uniref:Interleukin-17D isoform X1 n=1 Tax=Vicugna pacos TaxID=30538 RepID=A0ABM5EFZ2_VICPA
MGTAEYQAYFTCLRALTISSSRSRTLRPCSAQVMPSSGHKSTSWVEGFSEPRHLGEEVVVKKRLFSRWPVLFPERFSRREALPTRARTCPTSLPSEAASFRSAPRRSARTSPRRCDHRRHFGEMLGPPVWVLVAGVLLALSPGRAGGAPRAGRRPARARGCADRPEELLEQLYGRLAAGVLGAFHHTLQLGPREQARNASCPAGGRPADRRFRPPTNLRSVSPWAYRISYDPARYPKYLPEAYCLCRGCLTGPFGEEDFRFRSAPVFVPAVILRRTPACAGGRSVYTEEYVTVPVGCTCVPEQEKEADSVNSSMDKPGSKLLLSPSDKPGRP